MGMKPILSAMGVSSEGLGYHGVDSPRLDRPRGRRYRRPRFVGRARSWLGPLREGTFMKKLGILAALLAVVLLALPSPAPAQVKGVYWAASGTFGPFPLNELIPSLPKDKAKDVLLPANMFIIEHANGIALFDTGNNVAISDGKCKSYWSAFWCDLLKPSQKREDVIDSQLKKVGFSPDQVKAVISSHSHLDHIGNIKLFPKAVHILQKKELYQAWWPEKFQRGGGVFVMGDFDGPARDFNYLELDGDYDLFGDGSVMVLSTPGHTLGHQSIKAKLAGGHTVLLSQEPS